MGPDFKAARPDPRTSDRGPPDPRPRTPDPGPPTSDPGRLWALRACLISSFTPFGRSWVLRSKIQPIIPQPPKTKVFFFFTLIFTGLYWVSGCVVTVAFWAHDGILSALAAALHLRYHVFHCCVYYHMLCHTCSSSSSFSLSASWWPSTPLTELRASLMW